MQCVILCAGKGRRMSSLDTPKVLLPIGKTTPLDYTINLWRGLVSELIFIVGYKKELVIPRLPDDARVVLQEEQKGIAHAIAQVEPFVGGRFMVLLGDCIMKGKFHELPKRGDLGVGVWFSGHSDEVYKNYRVEIENDLIIGVEEKPITKNGLCGMGLYSFDGRVFDYIKKTKPSSLRGEVEITDVIQHMIIKGEELQPAYFEGRYVNVTTEEDLITAERIICSRR